MKPYMEQLDHKQAAAGETAEAVVTILESTEPNSQHEPVQVAISDAATLPAHVIGYAAAMELGGADSVQGWINFATTAALEAMMAVTEDGDDDAEDEQPGGALYRRRRMAGSSAFGMCMPPITSRKRAQAYIACVAAGLGYGFLTEGKARAMLYTGQLALAAHAGAGHQQRKAVSR
jgi:hypothetical protein